MGVGMYVVGAIIFSAYMYFTIWNIFYSTKKQREENYPNLKGEHDSADYDGMGNFSRFPSNKESQVRKKREKITLG